MICSIKRSHRCKNDQIRRSCDNWNQIKGHHVEANRLQISSKIITLKLMDCRSNRRSSCWCKKRLYLKIKLKFKNKIQRSSCRNKHIKSLDHVETRNKQFRSVDHYVEAKIDQIWRSLSQIKAQISNPKITQSKQNWSDQKTMISNQKLQIRSDDHHVNCQKEKKIWSMEHHLK